MSRKRVFAATLAAAFVATTAAACSSSASSSSSNSAAAASSAASTAPGSTTDTGSASGATVPLPGKTIGILLSAKSSEAEDKFAADTTQAATVLGWKTTVVDGQSNPQVWESSMQQLVSQHVDAILTIAIDAPTITQGLEAAKSAGIPVIATDVTVSPTARNLFTAVYSDNDAEMGKALADYVIGKAPGAKVVAQTASTIYATTLTTNGFAQELTAKRGSIVAKQDIDITNLVPSSNSTALSLVQGNPAAPYLLNAIDVAPAIEVPALQQANKTNVTLLTRYDDASTVKYIAAGVKLVSVACNTERTNLEALDALASYWAKKTPIPATYPGDDFQLKVIDKSNAPAPGQYVFPFASLLSTFQAKWKAEFSLNG